GILAGVALNGNGLRQAGMTTPHSRTFSATRDSSAAQSFCDGRHFAGDSYGEYEYKCDEEGLAVALKDRFPGRLFPLDFAIGSGAHAVTFLTLLKDGDETVAVEHRMSWFRNGEVAGITPGQSEVEPAGDMSYFGKVFRGDEMHRCVNCHVTTGRIIDGEIRDLTAGIHCERCHGPGAAHAVAAIAGDMDTALSAIRSHWTSAEEVAMCGDCHRMPRDVTTDRLTKYPNSLVRFQPIGLLQSNCYLNSGGALRCTTCHDAHDGVHSRSIERQTESCLSCHSHADQTKCAAKETAKCIECHMPAIELVPGVSFHDHWIRVRRDTPIPDNTEDASDHASALKGEP
ncbi:MAG: multiheme c-type cytochrome, partial [Planctomycetaceae bacterium]